jgi:hypothetical protein
MTGWMILFALMALPGAAAALSGFPAPSLTASSLLFGSLFLIALLSHTFRSRIR